MSIGNSPEDDRPSVGEDDRPSVGRALQQARSEAGLTVEAVSAATRVRVPIVQAIEQDDFSRCGGDVYARGHIRTLARAVDLDPGPLIEQFDAAHGGRPEPTVPTPLFESERIRPEPRRPNWTAAMVAAIVAVIGFVGFTLFSGGGKGGDGPVSAGGTANAEKKPAPAPNTTRPTARPTAPDPAPSDSAIAGLPKDKVTIKVTARDGQSWVSAKDANGRLLQDGLLKKGQSKTFTDKKRIDLVLGNAGAVQLYVNGKEVKHVGDEGSVERLSYTPGDPQAG
ncbi:helix-turn-helix domain-containing protein [Streptomyces chattanoogensis]|uniref:Membrane protein n=1 Tax=Streptomyces chattanoogensis TaxID=66876 RepID=A0A0N0H080_9ACTN|nr:helix-turn-helix domain-containing protein [Streptomyces chattanoogensis]KPC63389.1 membrane protein [Streptomyces chattanoogensis]